MNSWVMRIKQQKAIRQFLIDELGEEKGGSLFEAQNKLLIDMIGEVSSEEKSRYKTLAQTILSRISLYKTLCEYLSDDSGYQIMRKYMLDVIAAKKHESTAKMEAFPGFFYIYRASFLRIMKTTRLQKSTQSKGSGYYDITIKKCLWHDACVRFGCPELCRLFCDVDDVTYGGLRKIAFTRTKTLGYGGDCCDFHFYKKG